MNLAFHIALLPLELLLQHLQLLVGELLPRQLLGQRGVALPVPQQLHLQVLEGLAQLGHLALYVAVLLVSLPVGRLPGPRLALHVLDASLVVPSGLVEFLLVLDPEHFELVVLLLLVLAHGFLLVGGLLQQFALLLVLLLPQLLHLPCQLPVLDLELSRLQLQGLELSDDGELAVAAH